MIIRAQNISKVYNLNTEAEFFGIRDVSLEINKGELIAIVGPSGAGKTTLFNILGTLDTPTFGQIEIKNKNILSMDANEKSKLRNKVIGFIFQQFRLIPTLSALDNALLPLLVSEEGVDSPRKEKVIHLFETYGLKNQLTKYPSQLSGGEQQRVAIIRALVNDPDIILADEPTGSLDSKMSEYVFDTLQQIHKNNGKTVIYITHNLNLVEKANRVIKIEDGRVISDETCLC
ncbi:putative ABC transport system ATP-binding protein [Kineothrix alysoides]|uniref:Putative ABC transport system ATP-binding protein n=1 Tax=Kineothrix alysoides TaxID=1469948 RepID=A0A4R1QUI0_9FIRM|nr:ABC transporter ATP-binding protein [Kineothrix alysoides]TCL57629.1 putative ABC transport system ATP-binding protein [Kineothrix alysoides]